MQFPASIISAMRMAGQRTAIALSLRFANDDLVSLCRHMDIITRNDANFYSSAQRLRSLLLLRAAKEFLSNASSLRRDCDTFI